MGKFLVILIQNMLCNVPMEMFQWQFEIVIFWVVLTFFFLALIGNFNTFSKKLEKHLDIFFYANLNKFANFLTNF
jgi:hypothetical protein